MWGNLKQDLEEESLGRLSVETLRWDGRNCFSSRHAAAAELSSMIAAVPSGMQVLLVGHSHGGTICHLALRDIVSRQRVQAVLTFATPYIAIWSQDLGHVARSTAGVLAAFAVGVWWSAMAIPVLRTDPASSGPWRDVAIVSLVALALFNGVIRRRLELRWRGGIARELLRIRSRQFALAHVPPVDVPFLCLQSPGDEALTWVRLADLVQAVALSTLRLEVLSWIFWIATFVTVAYSSFPQILEIGDLRAVDAFRDVWRIRIIGNELFDLLGKMAFVFVPMGLAVSGGLAGAAWLAVMAIGRVSSSTVGLGRSEVFAPFAVAYSTSVAPVNCDRSSVVTLRAGEGLRHSEIYRNSTALNMLRAWINARTGTDLSRVTPRRRDAVYGLRAPRWSALAGLASILALIMGVEWITSQTTYQPFDTRALPGLGVTVAPGAGWTELDSRGLIERGAASIGMYSPTAIGMFRREVAGGSVCACTVARIPTASSPSQYFADAIRPRHVGPEAATFESPRNPDDFATVTSRESLGLLDEKYRSVSQNRIRFYKTMRSGLLSVGCVAADDAWLSCQSAFRGFAAGVRIERANCTP